MTHTCIRIVVKANACVSPLARKEVSHDYLIINDWGFMFSFCDFRNRQSRHRDQMVLLIIATTFFFVSSCFAVFLVPTEQTSFNYPADGWGSEIPFPPYLAKLTGLSDWPALNKTPPFTPEMALAYYANIGAPFLRDIIVPPHASGISSFCCLIGRM